MDATNGVFPSRMDPNHAEAVPNNSPNRSWAQGPEHVNRSRQNGSLTAETSKMVFPSRSYSLTVAA